jgi:hypothetical protein
MNRYIKTVIAASAALGAGILVSGLVSPPPVEASGCLREPEEPVTITYYSNATFNTEVGWFTQYCCKGTTYRSGSATVYQKMRTFASCPTTNAYTDACYVNDVEVACP